MAVGKLKIPLSKEDLRHLEGVIYELELKTQGEIRLMIVGRSMAVGHLFLQFMACLTSVAFLFMWLERHKLIWLADGWLLPTALFACAVVAFGLSRSPVAMRAITPVRDLRLQTLQRAELEFYREGLGHTSGRTGILLFLSLTERQAVVLADQGISSKLNSDVWKGVVEAMLEGSRRGAWRDSLEKALRLCGALLAEHVPATPGNRNELPNTILIRP